MHTRVTTQSSLGGTRLNGSFQNIPILFFQGLPGTASNLLTESDGIARFGVTKVSASVFAFKQGGIDNVCACVFDGGKGRGFICNSSEDMESLGGLKDARLGLIMLAEKGIEGNHAHLRPRGRAKYQ